MQFLKRFQCANFTFNTMKTIKYTKNHVLSLGYKEMRYYLHIEYLSFLNIIHCIYFGFNLL